ncbi:MAG: hypothetical protein JRJ59_06890 [Deltaproteobacteria bacterium]|nr:hypothetical protein [Deltaproteobacteria bacterium]
MSDPEWTQTRAALAGLSPLKTAKLLPKLLVKGPGLMAKAQELLRRYPFQDDRFKILMVHELERELPDFKEVYQAILADLMAGRPRLEA